jgi:hypothetical protein
MIPKKLITLLILSLIYFSSSAQDSPNKSSYCDSLYLNIEILKTTLNLPKYLNINPTTATTFDYKNSSIDVNQNVSLYINTIAVNRQDSSIKRVLASRYPYDISPKKGLSFKIQLPKTNPNIILNWDYLLYFFIKDDAGCNKENIHLIKFIPLIDTNYDLNSSISIKYHFFSNGIKSDFVEHSIRSKKKEINLEQNTISFTRSLKDFQLQTLRGEKIISQTTLLTIYLLDNDEIDHYQYSFKRKSKYTEKLSAEEQRIFQLINKDDLLTVFFDKTVKLHHLDIYVFKRDHKIIRIKYVKKGDGKYGTIIIDRGSLKIYPDIN